MTSSTNFPGPVKVQGRYVVTAEYNEDGSIRALVDTAGMNISTFQSPIDTTQAPYAAMTGPTQLIGSALTGTYPFRFMESFWEAIRRKSCKVLFLGDSVTENIAQNWPMGHWTIEFERELMRAFPDVAFEFINFSIGGKIARQVLGRAAGDSLPDASLGASFLSNNTTEDTNHYVRNTATGANAPTNPETWPGPAAGVTDFTNNEVWMSRVAPHNFDLMTLCFGLNEENFGGNWWFAASVRAIIDNVRIGTTFNGFTRPSIICATPYNDTTDRQKRNRLAEQMFAVAQQNGCPVIDANRWDGIAVEGVDRCRQRWYGEGMYRYLIAGKNANDLLPNRAEYWAQSGTGTPNTGAGGTATDYLSTSNSGSVKLLRKKLSRDVQVFLPCNSPSSGTVTQAVVSIWYRVDPDNNAIGYELKYVGTGTLTLTYHGTTGDIVLFTKSVYALTGTIEPFNLYLRAVGAVHECWTVFGAAAPATGGDPKSSQLQMRVTHSGGELGMEAKSDVFKEGWCGFELNSTGTVYPSVRAGNYSTQSLMLQFGYPLLVNQLARVNEFDMNGRVSLHMNYQADPTVDYDGDNRGGNAINHLATDAYSLAYAAAIGSVVRQLNSSRRDVTTLASSAVAITAPADTAENSLATIFIPAGTIGKNGELFISATFNYTGSTNNKTTNIKFGATQGGASSLVAQSTTTAGNVAFVLETRVKARNDYKKQLRLPIAILGSSQTVPSEITVDTTVDNYIYFTATKASAGESMKLERYIVQYVGG